MKHRARCTAKMGARKAGGFSLIEVLIALLVLAFGLLGFALLQTMNLRYTQSANYRTEATNLAYGLLDQMRANRLSVAQYSGASFTKGSKSGQNCSRPLGTTDVAQNIARWQCQVVEALGDEAGAQVSYANGEASVRLSWGERLALDNSTTFEVRTRL